MVNILLFLLLSRNTQLFLIISILLYFFVYEVDSDTSVNQIKAYHTSENIVIDGNLSESDWKKAEVIDKFVQIEPHEGKCMTEPMELRILYDKDNIYFGFICYDSDMSKLVANEMRRDAWNIHENDNVFVLIDTYNDKRSGFFFRINALGAIQDRAVTDNGDTFHDDWDIVISGKSRINENSWTTELRVPFQQLRFKQTDPLIWGINVGREIARKQEEAVWMSVPASYGGRAKYRTTNLGTLIGLEGIKPTRNLEFLPYVLPGMTHTIEGDNSIVATRQLKFGFDAKYGIATNLTADLTFNTDFAQVEADEEQVNLTRFSLFFPEKRPFFLEGAGHFNFGVQRRGFGDAPPVILFYSRNIGFAEGNSIPILFGGKVSGKVGSYGIGFLNVLTDEFSGFTDDDKPIDVPISNYSVMRLTKDVIAGSRIGMILVNKDQRSDYNRAGGFDFQYRPNDFLDIRGMWSRTFSPDMSGRNNAWHLSSRFRTDNFRINGSYTDIDEDFDPAVGYVQQSDIRHFSGEIRWVPRPQKYGIREIWSGPSGEFLLNTNNELEKWSISYRHWTSFTSADNISFFGSRTYERLFEEYEIRDDVFIPVGEYYTNLFGANLSLNESRMLHGWTGVEFGEFYSGHIRSFFFGFGLKPNGQLSLNTNYRFNRIILPSTIFDANLFTGRINYSFTTDLYAKILAQWNAEESTVSINFLINYIYRPGSDFYFVFNQTYETDKTKQTVLKNSTVVGKMTFWWNP